MNYERIVYFMMLMNAFGLIIGVTNEPVFIVVLSMLVSSLFYHNKQKVTRNKVLSLAWAFAALPFGLVINYLTYNAGLLLVAKLEGIWGWFLTHLK